MNPIGGIPFETRRGKFMVDARTDTLGALLCGELAAVETYQLAIKLAGGPGTAGLRQILTDHREAAIDLRQHIQLAGGAAGDIAD